MEKGWTLFERMVIVGITLLIFVFLLQPYFEMKAFNKFSETKANYFDAVFSELRVIPR